MAIKTLVSQEASNAAVARLLGVSEGTVRYHLERLATGAMDGRGMKTFKAASVAEAIEHWRQSGQDGAINLAALHAWLVAEHGYDGSLRSVQRFWARHYPAPVIRARRRVEHRRAPRRRWTGRTSRRSWSPFRIRRTPLPNGCVRSFTRIST